MPTRAESPLTELDAALDRLEQLNRNLGNNRAYNAHRERTPGFKAKPTKKLKQEIARQRELVRRIAKEKQGE